MPKRRGRSSDDRTMSRRALIAGAAASATAAVLQKVPLASALRGPPSSATPAPPSGSPSDVPGTPTSAVSVRSTFESPARTPTGAVTGSSLTPLHQLTGTITPNDLLFERHHSGIPAIDPATYKLVIHGLVDRPMVFTLDDLKRLPSVSRIAFIECAGNGRAAYKDPKPEMTPQQVDGLTSNGEWTGVPLAVILREIGAQRGAEWFFAEGGDAAKMSRSIPIRKGWDDAIIAYAYNGEALRPSNGYPARLLLPGYEGNTCVKWLRRIKLVDQPNMSKDETSKYTDPLPDGTARQFSFEMDVKSVITSPTFPSSVARGWREITGIAWSGRGKIARVDVTTDGGATWSAAELQGPVLDKAHTRFRSTWEWKGAEAVLMSRATDDTGAVQPTRAVFTATRGPGTDYHYNLIRSWRVATDGRVTFAG